MTCDICGKTEHLVPDWVDGVLCGTLCTPCKTLMYNWCALPSDIAAALILGMHKE